MTNKQSDQTITNRSPIPHFHDILMMNKYLDAAFRGKRGYPVFPIIVYWTGSSTMHQKENNCGTRMRKGTRPFFRIERRSGLFGALSSSPYPPSVFNPPERGERGFCAFMIGRRIEKACSSKSQGNGYSRISIV